MIETYVLIFFQMLFYKLFDYLYQSGNLETLFLTNLKLLLQIM